MLLKSFYKSKNKFLLVAAVLSAGFVFASMARARDLEVKIKILPDSRISVEGKLTNAKTLAADKNFSFSDNYADVSGLGNRIENLELFGADGAKLEVKKLAAGAFLASEPPRAFRYEVKTTVPANPVSAAHVTSLDSERGLLMMSDLLPQLPDAQPISARVFFEMPESWKISSSEKPAGRNAFEVKNVEKAIFLIGKNWREQTARIGQTEINLAISGTNWQFSDADALQMASMILREHAKIFGEIPVEKMQIFLLPLSAQINPDRWRAETRGANVTILSGALPSKNQALQRLHEQLRHEIFHLWIPNAVSLTGNYDWFYEGFTIYEALRTGVSMNQIRFEDFLNTLARAFDAAQNQNRSLVEMSANRWLNANNSVYAKGMVVAFLCDAALQRESRGRRSVADIFRRVYQKYKFPNLPQDGNSAILEILKSYRELNPVVQNYVEGTAKIDWSDDLRSLGIENARSDFGTQLKVVAQPDKRQRDLLDKLGYNQWRKLLLRETK